MIVRSGFNQVELPAGTSVLNCLKALKSRPQGTLAALCGGVVLELNDLVSEDCELFPLTLEHEEGRRVYERSLRFVMLLALKHLFPYQQVRIEYSVGYGVYVRLPGVELHRQEIVKIENEMRRIVREDLPFVKKQWTREEAIDYFTEEHQPDKVDLLNHRRVPTFTMYSVDDMWEYFYGAMTVSTGYVSVFTLFELRGGFVLQLPAGSDFDHAAPYIYRPKHLAAFQQSSRWCDVLGVRNVTDVTKMIEHDGLRSFIRVNEALHEAALGDLAETITSQFKHFVLVAGPTSSGKTTFANRLAIHLQVCGHPTRILSMDDFYYDRSDLAAGDDGNIDLESINVLDLPLMEETINALLSGEDVYLPSYDFATGIRSISETPISLKPGEILLLEGIHALNPVICEHLPSDEIFKIFASPLTVLNLDDHNRIRTTDVRLLRRVVRDYLFRGADPEKTLSMWSSVRRGEELWIFPYQETADAMFNTTLHYELPILKHYAFELLDKIPPESPRHLLARRLVKTLNYLPDVDPEILSEVPPLSLLREFVGGCTLYL